MTSLLSIIFFLFGLLAGSCRAQYFLILANGPAIDAPYLLLEGPVGHVFVDRPSNAPDVVMFHELAYSNPFLNPGDVRFYTINEAEVKGVLADPVWEAIGGWYVYNAPAEGRQALHRLYQKTTRIHLWSFDPAEIQHAQTVEGGSYTYEEVACWLPIPAEPNDPNSDPIVINRYRELYNPYGV